MLAPVSRFEVRVRPALELARDGGPGLIEEVQARRDEEDQRRTLVLTGRLPVPGLVPCRVEAMPTRVLQSMAW